MQAVDHDVDADVEFASDVVGGDACGVVTHVAWPRGRDVHDGAVEDLVVI